MKEILIRGLVVASVFLAPGIALARQGVDNVGAPAIGMDTSIHIQTEVHGSIGRDHDEDNFVKIGRAHV